MTLSRLSSRIWLSAALFAGMASLASAAPAPAPYRPPGRPAAPKVEYLADDAVLARVNDRAIRVSDYVSFWFSSSPEFRPVGDSLGRVEFLKRLTDKEILAEVAREAKAPETFEDRAVLRNHTQTVLGNALFQHAVLESVHVHEAEAESIYAQMKRELRLDRIRFGSLATAERMRRDLASGRMSWSRAWGLRLRMPGDATSSPDIGWQTRQNTPPDLARSLFSLPVGGISEPVAEPPGYALYRVKEERPLKLQEFRMYRGILMDQLRNEKTAYYRERLVAGLRKSVELRIDSLTAQWIASRFPKKVSGEGSNKIVVDVSVPSLAPEDTGRVLATWRGGKVTVGRLIENYRATPDLVRPSLDTPAAVVAQVDVIVLEPRFADMARQRGYDRDATFAAQIERKREEIQVEHLFRDSIQARVFVSPDARRKYYRESQHRFVTPPNARFAAFYVDSLTERDSLAAQLRRGVPAARIIRADSIAGHPRGMIFDRRQGDENLAFPQVFSLDMQIGDVTFVGPNKEGGYNVLQLIARDSGRPVPFEEADAQIDEYLQQVAADEKLAEFVERHSRRMKVETHPELVMRIRLRDPNLAVDQASAQR